MVDAAIHHFWIANPRKEAMSTFCDGSTPSIAIAPLVVILMPVYQLKSHLQLFTLAIESIRTQTYTNWRLHIWDDGSTDDTLSIIQSYADVDKRIHVFGGEHHGVAKALNSLIATAMDTSCDYISRADSDDWCEANRLEVQVQFLNANLTVDVLGSAVKLWHLNSDNLDTISVEDLRAMKSSMKLIEHPLSNSLIRWALPFYSPLAHPTIIARKSFFRSLQYPDVYDIAEDYALWLEVSRSTDCHFANLAHPCVVLTKRKQHKPLQIINSIRAVQHHLQFILKIAEIPSLDIECLSAPHSSQFSFQVFARVFSLILMLEEYWITNNADEKATDKQFVGNDVNARLGEITLLAMNAKMDSDAPEDENQNQYHPNIKNINEMISVWLNRDPTAFTRIGSLWTK